MARLAPLALASSQARSTAPVWPAMTIWVGSLKLTGSTTAPGSAAAASRQTARTSSAPQAEDDGHAALPDRHRVLHRLGAEAHQRHRVLEADHAGGDQRRVFAEAVAGHHGRRRAAGGDPGAVHGDRRGQHHRLGVGGQVEVFFRAFGDQAAEVEAERVGRFGDGVRRRRRCRRSHSTCRRLASPGRETGMRIYSSNRCAPNVVVVCEARCGAITCAPARRPR